ncbi:uncharacterized protein LOC117110774 [Anneissia japonica]|uniref:uncharacterized protein LOC117110774 n=1 Tax=Anneissia japonica TaxID=1529436 RepID=UPI0014257752|nr:uncharacterized protein LOC117110774 [Anneissia japonica]
MSSGAIMIWLVVLLSQTAILLAQDAQVFFLQTTVSVEETNDSSFTLNVRKTGNIDTSITILIAPIENIQSDFGVPYTQTREISAGNEVETFGTTWNIRNDDIPEGDEVFIFELSDLSGSEQVVISQAIVRVTILANDDA